MGTEQDKKYNPLLHGKSPIFININVETINELLRDIPVVPAKIKGYTLRPSQYSSSLDIRLKFIYESGFDKNYDNQPGYININASKMGDLLRYFDIPEISHLPQKNVIVFTKYLEVSDKRLVFGIMPKERYNPDMFKI